MDFKVHIIFFDFCVGLMGEGGIDSSLFNTSVGRRLAGHTNNDLIADREDSPLQSKGSSTLRFTSPSLCFLYIFIFSLFLVAIKLRFLVFMCECDCESFSSSCVCPTNCYVVVVVEYFCLDYCFFAVMVHSGSLKRGF